MTKPELLEKKGRLANEANEILEAAHKDGREALRSEEESKFNALHADIEKISSHIALINKQEDVERSLTAPGQRKTEPNLSEQEVLSYRGSSRLIQGARDQQLAVRAWFMAGAPSHKEPIPKELTDAANRVGLNLNNKHLNFRLGQQALRSRHSEDVKWWQQAVDEERALSGPQSTTSLGGYTIQDAAMREVEIAMLAYGGMRQVSTILRTDTGGPLPIPTINDTTNVGALIGEATTVGTQDFTFSQLTLDAWTYTSRSVLVSVQLMQDNSVNLGQIVGGILAERLGRITNTHYTLGTGTGQPNGVVTAATFVQATTGAANMTGISYANLLALYHSVDPSYRGNARWMFNDNTLMRIKLMVDSSSRPLWLPGLVDRAPDTILGSPYTINQDMAVMTATAKSMLFGDFSKYWIRDVRDFTLVRLDERFAEFLQVAFLAYLRTDGDLLNAGTGPIRGYQNSTA